MSSLIYVISDVGLVGLSDPGEPDFDLVANPDPHADNYDPIKNYTGTESNWQYDPGEPYIDAGFDGGPNTNDQGEGNGLFDQSLGRKCSRLICGAWVG